jgi:hypothetical protein
LLIDGSASGGNIRIKFVLLTTLILAFGLAGFAQPQTTPVARGGGQPRAHLSTKTRTIQQLANAVADAFTMGTLGGLDAGRPYVGTVRMVIENLSGEIERKTVRTLAQAERWLKSRETHDGQMTFPRRNSGALLQCRRGLCTFEPAGGLHNMLYIAKITYGMMKGKPYIKTIYLVND